MRSINNVYKLKNALLIFSVIFTMLPYNVFSQNKKPTPPKKQTAVMKKGSNELSKTRENIISGDAANINMQMNEIKKRDDKNSYVDLKELIVKSEALNKNTITLNNSVVNANSVFRKAEANNTDNITKSQIYADGLYVTSLATQVEQRGVTAGKIWLLVSVGAGDTGAAATGDSLILYSSVDNGETYSQVQRVAANLAVKVNRDELDMEIIEDHSGTKYIYVTLGYTTSGYLGDKRIALLVFNDAGGFGEASMNIPGFSAASDYFRPRITSDNSTYSSLAYVNVAFMQDSVSGAEHYLMSKFFRIYDPYTLSPSITYFPQSIFVPAAFLSNDFRAQTDIAYFNNSNDSVIFVMSGYPGYSGGVYLYKAHANTNVYPVYSGLLESSFPGDEIEFARIASNGGYENKNLVITYSDNFFNTGDWDQWIFSTQNASDWTSTYLDYSGNHSSNNGDIIGKRNTEGSFNIAYKNTNSCVHSISSSEIRNNSVYNVISNLNDNYAFSFFHPKPAFRNVSNDSVLTFWGSYYNLFATGGSNAIRINVTSAIEGYYDINTDNEVREDYVRFYLHNDVAPYTVVDSTELFTYTCTLNKAVVFKNASDGDYYISVKYRNSLEAWSSAPLNLTKGENWVSYDFTSSSGNTYGNNAVEIGSRWCFYSGDVNQDGSIDLTDVLLIYNDAGLFITGLNLLTDLNGDLLIDLTDMLIAYNNSNNFVSVKKP